MRYGQAFAITKRLDQLLALVASGLHSSPVLASKLGVSEQTVYRDIVFLRKQGHPIRSVKLSPNWAYQLAVDPKAKHSKPVRRRK
jgi:biotin operon repressor